MTLPAAVLSNAFRCAPSPAFSVPASSLSYIAAKNLLERLMAQDDTAFVTSAATRAALQLKNRSSSNLSLRGERDFRCPEVARFHGLETNVPTIWQFDEEPFD
jgi:hypothetical protein